MATWTNIANQSLEPGSPARSVDAFALRDNPIAIAQGAAGAPRIVDQALSANVTQAGTDWVLARNAAVVADAVGSYTIISGAFTLNSTRTISGKPGTWRAMGTASNSFSYFQCLVQGDFGCNQSVSFSFTHSATLHVRIS